MMINVEELDGELRFTATDDGRGIDVAKARGGSGIQNMMDRMAALRGSLDLRASRAAGPR
jgi:signal transduction histidine kinase